MRRAAASGSIRSDHLPARASMVSNPNWLARPPPDVGSQLVPAGICRRLLAGRGTTLKRQSAGGAPGVE